MYRAHILHTVFLPEMLYVDLIVPFFKEIFNLNAALGHSASNQHSDFKLPFQILMEICTKLVNKFSLYIDYKKNLNFCANIPICF